ncbi:hypothetical protein K437DRAFT_260031 [Tilletiaria anomala UBC 951]|uniref:Rad1-domain-containing protein n=1 Tax=Tilletiaria anomala (strain ATCC 24038 / CBS 436.72 / UBC 951) TaxID=1037660 RepID=A0A066VDS4_TILAU|nr:uncharacterized protein K437DRAFT_260031 [Tilletiaria anomala UBC 951]KDN36745.1 hypothetical protein K437DRAFT_260031 [Tilletiaria anomala UBC 951]
MAANSGPAFVAHSSDVRLLSNILRPIAHSSHVLVTISDTGIEFLTTSDRSFQAHAYIKRILFPKWQCRKDPTAVDESPMNTTSPGDQDAIISHVFEISLKTLLECLDIFGGAPAARNIADTDWMDGRPERDRTGGGGDVLLDKRKGAKTAMMLRYTGKGDPLVVMLEDNDVVTSCELATLEPDDTSALGMDHRDMRAQIIMQAEWITVVLQSFHATCSRIIFSFTPSKAGRRGFLRIFGDTDAGSVDATLPGDGKAVAKFICERKVEFTYSFEHVSRSLKGLSSANKTSVRIDGQGLLSIQCLIPINSSLMEDATCGGRNKIEASHLPIVDYLCCPYED